MKYETLCISGGGRSGISFVSTLHHLEKNNIVFCNEFKKYIGCSIGAFISFLLTFMNIKQIMYIFANFKIDKLAKKPNTLELFENFGLDNGGNWIIGLQTIILEKFGLKDINYKTLYEKTNKELGIVATNFNKMEEVYFSYKTTPDFSVIESIRMSIGYPILFTPFKYNNNLYIDGGVVNPAPINYSNNKPTLLITSYRDSQNNPKNITEYFTGIYEIVYKSLIIKL